MKTGQRVGVFGMLIAIVLAGCATVDSVKEAKGPGVKRTFRQPYDLVFQAAVNAATRRKLELVEENRAGGRLVLSHGASWTSLGERIALFVTRAGDRSTVVEVVSRPFGGRSLFRLTGL